LSIGDRQADGNCGAVSSKFSHFPPPIPTIIQEALLMLMVKTGLRVGNFLLGAFLVAGLAGPAFAGNVYSWVTEDGTYAFTDDSKRIPAKHKAEAKKRPMGKLTRYERFTEVDSEKQEPYTDRLRERRLAFRNMTSTAPMGAVVGAVQSQGPGIVYSTPVSGGRGDSGASVQIPIGQVASAPSETTTIESIRTKPRHNMATRHWTVVKNGDRLVTVIKGELNQRPLKSKSESDFDL
jgi:hypothetical protein